MQHPERTRGQGCSLQWALRYPEQNTAPPNGYFLTNESKALHLKGHRPAAAPWTLWFLFQTWHPPLHSAHWWNPGWGKKRKVWINIANKYSRFKGWFVSSPCKKTYSMESNLPIQLFFSTSTENTFPSPLLQTPISFFPPFSPPKYML